MAKYTVESDNLSSIADAIREKGKTTDQLEFPQGFVDAIGAIATGGDYDETLLWTNQNPSSPFNGTSLSIGEGGLSESLTNFDFVKLTYKKLNTDVNPLANYCMMPQSPNDTYIFLGAFTDPSVTPIRYRAVRSVDGNSLFFYSTISGTSTYNWGLIPIRIYGVKRLSAATIAKFAAERARMMETLSSAEKALLFKNEEAAE